MSCSEQDAETGNSQKHGLHASWNYVQSTTLDFSPSHMSPSLCVPWRLLPQPLSLQVTLQSLGVWAENFQPLACVLRQGAWLAGAVERFVSSLLWLLTVKKHTLTMPKKRCHAYEDWRTLVGGSCCVYIWGRGIVLWRQPCSL